MSFRYYQEAQPGWGTNQYRFGPPPTPSFQPQSTWGGYDFYRAHAHSPDLSLYEHAWNRVREYRNHDDAVGNVGVGLHEAREWHRRAYGGAGELERMQPSAIGHAAAYEAYRTWLHNRSIYEPLSGDHHRQREALVGLAIAEASRLLPYARRDGDHISRRAVAEAAAATATALFFANREGHHHRHHREYDDDHRGRTHSRWRSGSGSSYGSYDDPYAFDDDLRDRGRSRSRYRSHSRGVPIIGHAGSHSGSFHEPHYTGGYASSMPVGTSLSYGGQPYGGYPSSGGGMQMVPSQQPYMGQGVPMSLNGSAYGGSQYAGVPQSASSYGSFAQSPTLSYAPAAGPYMAPGNVMGAPMMPGVLQQPLIIEKPHSHKSKHRHRSHRRRSHSRSSRHHRSRSVEPYVDHYPPGYHY